MIKMMMMMMMEGSPLTHSLTDTLPCVSRLFFPGENRRFEALFPHAPTFGPSPRGNHRANNHHNTLGSITGLLWLWD